MEYQFLDQGDEKLLEMAARPLDGGIALAVRTTGYNATNDEVLELSICNLDGKPLFSKRVKPQNVTHWDPSPASGGVAPADVKDALELFLYEDEIMQLVEKAPFVVCEHPSFAEAMIAGSWVTLPHHESFDLAEEFRQSHSAKDYAGTPAAAVSLADIAAYYGIGAEDDSGKAATQNSPAPGTAPISNPNAALNGNGSPTPSSGLASEAALVAACYRALVEEHENRRASKGAAYWEDYEQRKSEEAAASASADAKAQLREKRYRQMNGLLWVAGAIIFASLVIQLYQRGSGPDLMVIATAASAFCVIRGIINLKG